MKVVSRSQGGEEVEFQDLDAVIFDCGTFAVDSDGYYFLCTEDEKWVVIARPAGCRSLDIGETFATAGSARVISADDLALSIP